MSDKHEAKQKSMRAKAHGGNGKVAHTHEPKDSHIDGEVKQAAGDVQEELSKFRRSAGHAHQG